MSKFKVGEFKVGDKLRRKVEDAKRNGWPHALKTLTVASVSQYGDLRFAEDPISNWSPAYFEHAEAQPAPKSAKDAAVLGGLQAHSVGGSYPLCVVGYSALGGKIIYVVENLQDGTVAGTNGGTVRQWRDPGFAWSFIGLHPRAVDYDGDPIVWIKGRPVQDTGKTYASLALPKAPKPTLFEQRLAELSKEYGRPLTPYEQYYLAVSIENGD